MIGSYHCNVYEAFKAAKNLDFNIGFSDSHSNKIRVIRGTDETVFEQEDMNNDVTEVSAKITRSLRMEHRSKLQKLASCGMNFKTLENTLQSKFMMNNCRAPIQDPLFRFILRCRTNTLMTPALQYNYGMIPEEKKFCNCREGHRSVCNISHILNNCTYYLSDYTKRHNAVVDKIQELVMNTIEPEKIYYNQEVLIKGDMTKNGKEYKTKRRPDLWYWREENDKKMLELVEVKVPWGSYWDDVTGEVMNNLERVEREAKKKYEDIKKEIKKQLIKEAEGKKIVVNVTIILYRQLEH
jgi:hypothetical protein